MLILSCPSKLQFLEGLLKKSLPQTLQVCGAVMNINRGNPVGHEVIVDSWPDFKAVLTRPQRETVLDDADTFSNIYAAFYRDLDAYRRLLLDTDVINWDQSFTLCGGTCIHSTAFKDNWTFHRPRAEKEQLTLDDHLSDGSSVCVQLTISCPPDNTMVGVTFLVTFYHFLIGNHDGIYEVSKDAGAAKKVQLSATPYFSYLNPNPDKQPQPRLDPGFTFSSLNSSHIDLLNETWHFGGSEQSRRYLANMVRCFPSTCILDSNSHPISWTIMESLGTLRHGYTLPSYRRRGYSAMVLREQARRVHAAGFPVYVLVALNNIPSQKLLVSHGFQKLSELCHYCIHSPASWGEKKRATVLVQVPAQSFHSTAL